MKIVCISYRDWALKIYDYLKNNTEHDILIISSKEEYDESIIRKFKPDYILFYGWSWFIKEDLLKDFKCIMLHPSPLPKYRGGSPIQNQIINNEKTSAVTLFLMNEIMDGGDIILQEEISLEGHLHEILDRITKKGIELTMRMLEKKPTPMKQNHKVATVFKRRKPEDSEITLEEIQNADGEYLYNKIRMLEDPYPNAYIKTKDGKKLIIKCAEIES